MTLENTPSSQNEPGTSIKGLVGLAETEIGIIQRLRESRKRGYRTQISQLVIDLTRIMEKAEENHIQLPNLIKAEISDFATIYPDRNRYAKRALEKYKDQ